MKLPKLGKNSKKLSRRLSLLLLKTSTKLVKLLKLGSVELATKSESLSTEFSTVWSTPSTSSLSNGHLLKNGSLMNSTRSTSEKYSNTRVKPRLGSDVKSTRSTLNTESSVDPSMSFLKRLPPGSVHPIDSIRNIKLFSLQKSSIACGLSLAFRAIKYHHSNNYRKIRFS